MGARQLPTLNQKYSKSPVTKDPHTHPGGSPEDHKLTAKQLYGQILLEQVKDHLQLLTNT